MTPCGDIKNVVDLAPMQKNRTKREAAKRRYTRRALFLREVKSKPCADCGNVYPPYVMHFDHVRGEKLFNIGNRITIAMSRLLAEIAKCDLVCANCHAIRTHS